MEMLDLSKCCNTLPEVTRVRYFVKVKNERGECAIYTYNCRELALANAFNVATVCQDCKVYFVRCRTI